MAQGELELDIPGQFDPGYTPSLKAWEFHGAPFRFRTLVWGWKSGKSEAVGHEFLRACLAMPGRVSWVVAPTYRHLKNNKRILMRLLRKMKVLLASKKEAQNEITLINGHVIEFSSADWPESMLGPNIDGIVWIDESAFIKEEAWEIIRSRVSASGAEIINCSTPNGRNWFYHWCVYSGMPADADYGTFRRGNRWVSHYPTWMFPWVPKGELREMYESMPRLKFDQNFGAKFLSGAEAVFHHIEECMNKELPAKDFVGTFLMGLDLAKHQDWTVPLIMDSNGRVHDVQRWSQVPWRIQRPRIIKMAQDWGHAVVVIDRANAGSVIEEDLRAAGVKIEAVDMNSPIIRRTILEELQIAFERSAISIPDPKASWAPKAAGQLYEELKGFSISITKGGRTTYTQSSGLNDDCVMALALANHGRMRGAAGAASPIAVAGRLDYYAREMGGHMAKVNQAARLKRPKIFGQVFQRRSKNSVFGEQGGLTSGGIWH
jgi:hypothetical protein